jgi:hypothetical protein
LSIYIFVFICFAYCKDSLYTSVMGSEDHQNNQIDNLAHGDETISAARRDLRNVDDVETGFHILARMIADFHLRRKGSYKLSSLDEEPYNTPQ